MIQQFLLTLGNAPVALSLLIQFQMIGKHVFNLIPFSHDSEQFAASTEFNHNHQKPNNTAKNHPNKYAKIFLFIKSGIKI